jgi:hypothetical protein
MTELERQWRTSHPLEWSEWVKVRPALFPLFGRPDYDFQDFLAEVGNAPSTSHAITRVNSALPWQAGNLCWAGKSAPPVESPYFDYERAAAYCACAVKTLQNAKANGHIRAVGGGAGVKFERNELDRWMTARPTL